MDGCFCFASTILHLYVSFVVILWYSAALLVYLRLNWQIYMTDEIKKFDTPEEMNADTFFNFVSEFC